MDGIKSVETGETGGTRGNGGKCSVKITHPDKQQNMLRQGVRWSDDLSFTEAHFKNSFFGSKIKVFTFLYPILILTM